VTGCPIKRYLKSQVNVLLRTTSPLVFALLLALLLPLISSADVTTSLTLDRGEWAALRVEFDGAPSEELVVSAAATSPCGPDSARVAFFWLTNDVLRLDRSILASDHGGRSETGVSVDGQSMSASVPPSSCEFASSISRTAFEQGETNETLLVLSNADGTRVTLGVDDSSVEGGVSTTLLQGGGGQFWTLDQFDAGAGAHASVAAIAPTTARSASADAKRELGVSSAGRTLAWFEPGVGLQFGAYCLQTVWRCEAFSEADASSAWRFGIESQVMTNTPRSDAVAILQLPNEFPLLVDRVAPRTQISADGPESMTQPGTYTGPVTFILTATDDLSGVAAKYYRLSGATTTRYSAPFTISTEGWHCLGFYSADNSGNYEALQDNCFEIDSSAT
jgi:hypothetical protein